VGVALGVGSGIDVGVIVGKGVGDGRGTNSGAAVDLEAGEGVALGWPATNFCIVQ
jgi:hypothetical protein